jgi:hypothetical protein
VTHHRKALLYCPLPSELDVLKVNPSCTFMQSMHNTMHCMVFWGYQFKTGATGQWFEEVTFGGVFQDAQPLQY